jgi:hypothetical protein
MLMKKGVMMNGKRFLKASTVAQMEKNRIRKGDKVSGVTPRMLGEALSKLEAANAYCIPLFFLVAKDNGQCI